MLNVALYTYLITMVAMCITITLKVYKDIKSRMDLVIYILGIILFSIGWPILLLVKLFSIILNK